MAIDGKGAHVPPEVLRLGGRWYGAYPLRTRQVEALMEDRGRRWITPCSTGGSSRTARSGRRHATGASARCGAVGGGMQPT